MRRWYLLLPMTVLLAGVLSLGVVDAVPAEVSGDGEPLTLAPVVDVTVLSAGDSITDALLAVRPGGTVLLQGGTYRERVKVSVAPGRPEAPVRVAALPGQRPVIEGLLWVSGASHWTF